ncbi:flagellar FliJ family protein [Helicobacter sp. 23-1045]
MQTKFSKILRLKQSIVSKIELELMKVNAEILQKKGEIADLERLISEFSLPKGSKNYSEFLRFKEGISNIRAKITEENAFLQMMEARKVDITKQFQKSKIEFEKINYLHLNEVQNLLKKAQRAELVAMDEIALNKFMAQKKAER